MSEEYENMKVADALLKQHEANNVLVESLSSRINDLETNLHQSMDRYLFMVDFFAAIIDKYQNDDEIFNLLGQLVGRKPEEGKWVLKQLEENGLIEPFTVAEFMDKFNTT